MPSAEPSTDQLAHAVDLLTRAEVDPDVFALRPDYAACIVVAVGVHGGPSDASSESALAAAEAEGRRLLEAGDLGDVPQIAAWREAFRQFGVKPRQAVSSVEALLRRSGDGLPRIDRLTDHYNALSMTHRVPFGGEDLTTYVGPPRLVVATGAEDFVTNQGGEATSQPPKPGEVVWRDDLGVTCRRWNWRQCVRTRLTPETTEALYIIDGLGEHAESDVTRAGEALAAMLAEVSPGVVTRRRVITAQGSTPVLGEGEGDHAPAVDHSHEANPHARVDPYAGSPEAMWSGQPNHALVTELSGQRPTGTGRALDIGAGEGADAIWLAREGWQVTAVEPSPTALERAREAASNLGEDQITWVGSELAAADLTPGSYDLVTVMYPALFKGENGATENLVLDLVAPGGRLLVAHHAEVDRERALAHGFDPDDYAGHDDFVAAVRARAGAGDTAGAGWRVVTAELRPRAITGGGGAHHHDDLILRARRDS